MGRLKRAVTAALLAMAPTVAAADCAGREGACSIDSGSYHIVLPEAVERPVPVVVFLHGYGGSGAGVMTMTGMVDALLGRGYAVIAPDGTARPGGNGTRSWAFFPGWEGRDEAAFLTDLLADASDRFGVSQKQTVLSGFSAGGFMVNYLACQAPDSFAAYAPVSGGFWRPQPDHCAGPVRLFHTHGWNDGVVPLEGRYLGGKRFQQGDIYAGLELWRLTNGCDGHAPDKRWQDGEYLRRTWACDEGADIDFALFPGGHMIPKGWAEMMLDWFEAD